MITDIHELRKAGWKVNIRHFRKYKGENKQMTRGEYERYVQENYKEEVTDQYQSAVSSKGGTTRIELISPTGEKLIGEAKCSNKENYNRAKGRAIAFGRSFSTRGCNQDSKKEPN